MPKKKKSKTKSKKTKSRKTVKKSRKKVAKKSSSKSNYIVIQQRGERQPRFRDHVASGAGAGFGIAAGHAFGDWMFD